jgi:triacylglycerol esterase/lipase EstA (alpha/beta hydrolase family)
MGKQVKIFDLLTKKQSLNVFKTQKKKNQLADELRQLVSYKTQLLEILKSISTTNTKKTVSEVKSENWYNLKIQDELIAINNKIDFLSIELKNQNIQVALAADKQKKYEEKKIHYARIESIEKENKKESNLPSMISIRSKF